VGRVRAMAAIFNLNHPAHVVSFWIVHLTLANVIVLIVMLVVFALALVIPFPRHGSGDSSS
jgi:hypothetical protein